MKFVGLDLGGVNSLACERDDAGAESFHGNAHPDRPTCVLFPLVRKEKIIAGDEAQRNERGSGLGWPPLAMAASDGWSHATPPANGGRVLIATVWQRLNNGGRWTDPQWQPPDGLPALNKPTPAECLTAEARSVLKEAHCDAATAQAVIAIPNMLPEESQESLLGRLPAGSRLVWRSVAAAMSWADLNSSRITTGKHLAVLDAGLTGVEISVFEFRQQEMDGRMFRVPVRRLNRLHFINTDMLLADTPAPFSRLRPDMTRLEPHLGEISNAVGGHAACLLCGPLAEPLLALLQLRLPSISWTAPDAKAIARGSCLFAWRLARGWPTYLDVLPSLELFTLTEEHEPKWLPLIPKDCEVSGGRVFEHGISRRIFIEKHTTRLATWLQRSGETEFRKLSTDLPVQAAQNAWVDLNVSARSAGGFARVRITPSPGQFDVFGAGHSVMLNWQGMERIPHGPQERWPVRLQYGWPACGALYAHRRFFDEFLLAASDLEQSLELRDIRQRLARLGLIKDRARQTIAPHMAGITCAGGDAAPVNLLVCFSTVAPCKFMDGGYGGRSQISTPLPGKDDRTRRIARILWQRLKSLNMDANAASSEINAVIYILGRMGGYAPDGFQNQLANEIHPITNAVRLFAAGRVLQTPDHGRRLLLTIKEKADFGQVLNNNWLRMLVYVLYQRPDVLREVPREHVLAAASLCLDVFEQQVQRRNIRTLFMNSLRALALLLRVRRHAQARDFLSPDRCPQDEARLAMRFNRVLRQANSMRLRLGSHTLVERVTEWLDFAASTDEMPPIAPPDEDDEVDGSNDD